MRETPGRAVELTARQREVMRLMAEGKTNWEIASALRIGLEGAKYHVSEILARFEVSSREEAVAAWRRQKSPAGRMERWIRGLAGWSPAKVALGIGGAVVVVAGGALIALSLGSDEPTGTRSESTNEPPETAEELLNQMEERLSEDGRILRVRLETTRFSDGEEAAVDIEALFDFRDDQAHVTTRTKWENSLDTNVDQELVTGGFIYEDAYDRDDVTGYPTKDTQPPCIDAGTYLAAVLACGIERTVNYESPPSMLPATAATWEGRAAISFAYEFTYEVNDPPEPPGRPPTPTPGAGTPTASPTRHFTVTNRYSFYVDANSWLPLALEVTGTRSDTGPAGRVVIPYESELLDRSDVDADLFDPEAFGYRTPKQIEVDALDGAGIVYWLGREFDRRPAWPVMQLTRVEGGQDFPPRFQLVSMDYSSDANDQLNIAMWTAEGWDEFFGMLQEGGRQPGYSFAFDEACLVRTEHEVNGHRVTVLGGVSTGGGAGMTSTPTLSAGGACPEPDEFMAIVEVADGRVAVVNAPIGIFGRGELYEAFDSEEGMLAVAGSLVERQKGE